MKKLMLMAVCSLMVLGAASTKVVAQDFLTKHYIEVSGRAHKDVAPDMIYMTITINEKDYKNSSMASVEKKMIGKFQAMGIDVKKDLVVKDMASNFKHYFLIKSDPKLMKEYQLTVHSAQQAGEVILALEQLGISEVSVDKVECSQIAKYQDEVRVAAIKSAKARATLLSEAVGHTIGRAMHISENEHNHRTYGMPQVMMVKGNLAEDQVVRVPEIEFEKIRVETTVYVKFELK
ncbi:MAG: SIMPL domain-containing protein [Bacteroidales bacterium]|nr:SIMPL domain-containing protein [Bacteroidales bacterium]